MRYLSFIPTLFLLLLPYIPVFAQTMDQFEPELFKKIGTLHGQGKYEEALGYAKQWAEKVEKKFGTEDSTYAMAMTWQGVVSVKLELFDEAEKCYQAALKARGKVYGTKHKSYAGTLTNLGGLYLALGEYDKAEPLYRQGREIFAAVLGTEHPNYATTTTNLAYLYALCGRYELSEKLYNEAIAIHAKVHGKRSSQYAIALNNLALLYHDLKEHGKEMKLLEEVLDVSAEALGRDHPFYADYLNNLANLYIETKRYVEAEALYKQALDIYKETVGKNHSDYARSLNNLSSLYLVTRRYDEAIPLGEQAMRIWEKKLGKKHPQLASAYANLALLSLHKNDKTKAQNYINAAFSANSDKNFMAPDMESLFDSLKQSTFLSGPTTIQLCEQLVQMQNVICKNGQCTKEQYLSAVERSLFLSDRLQQSFMTDEDRLQLLSFGLPLLSAHIHAAIEAGINNKGNLEKAFWSADENKSALLESSVIGNANFGGIPDSLAQKEQDLKQQLDLMNKKLFEVSDEKAKNEIQTKIANLNLEIESFKRYISEKYPKYYAYRFKEEQPELRSLQALLPEKTMLLEFFLEDTLVYVFALTNKKLEVFRQRIESESLSKSCNAYRELISAYDQTPEKLKNFAKVAHELYTRLIEAPLKANPGNESLIIVADGPLGHIPFEAFLTEKVSNPDGYKNLPYLLRKYSLSYTYSAKLWMENHKGAKSEKEQTMLAMAATYKSEQNPSQTATRSGTLRNLRDALQDLPAAKIEVENLSRFFEGDFMTGLKATEASFKNKANKHGIIHLAMHGIIDIKNPILSSIAFSENGDTLEDNFLQAFEVSGLKTEANLVVLSACETGYGRFKQGEGVMSLARSFMYAGVPAMVVSLWQVNDASTAIIMKLFYKNLAKGMNKAEALRQAKLYYIDNVSSEEAVHPAFWAPFVQLGDSRALKIAEKPIVSSWVLFAGALLAALLAFAFFSRKKSGQAA